MGSCGNQSLWSVEINCCGRGRVEINRCGVWKSIVVVCVNQSLWSVEINCCGVWKSIVVECGNQSLWSVEINRCGRGRVKNLSLSVLDGGR